MSLELPLFFWWASPSTFTFIYWIVMAAWGSMQLKGQIVFKRLEFLNRFLVAAAIVFIINIFFDNLWIIGEGIRFSHLFPDGLQQIGFYLLRNAAMLMGALLIAGPFLHVINVQNKTWILIVIMIEYFLIWFSWAPNMAATDWTYAIREGYPGPQILQSFVISHVIGKLLQGLVYISLWKG